VIVGDRQGELALVFERRWGVFAVPGTLIGDGSGSRARRTELEIGGKDLTLVERAIAPIVAIIERLATEPQTTMVGVREG